MTINTPKQYAKEIFAEALALAEPAERRAFLNRACGGNPALRAEVESLLHAHEQAGNFLGKTMQIPVADLKVERTGTMIGRHKLLQKVGGGGFGVMCKLKLELQRQGLAQSV